MKHCFKDVLMPNLKNLLIYTTLSICAIQQALASPSCSENITDESYYEIDNRHYLLTEEQENQLAQLLDELTGDWRGELVQTECRGTIEQPIKIIDSSSVRLEIRSHSINRINLHAHVDFRKQNKKVIYQRRIFEQRDINSFVTDGSNAFIVTEKSYRHFNFSIGTVLLETIYKIRFEQSYLYLDIINYTNGFFNSEEHWVLRR